MKVFIASDHAALSEKEAAVKHLEKNKISVTDLGPFSNEPCDYPDYAKKVCAEVLQTNNALGILICGTGIGMSMAANKIKKIRCAVCSDTYSAKLTKQHNDANILALGARVLGEGLMLEVIDTFLKTPFSGEERHKKRINKIE